MMFTVRGMGSLLKYLCYDCNDYHDDYDYDYDFHNHYHYYIIISTYIKLHIKL